MFALNWLNFYLQSVRFLFLFSIVFKSIYFVNKIIIGVIFFCNQIFNALLMSLKKLLDENQKLNNSVQRG